MVINTHDPLPFRELIKIKRTTTRTRTYPRAQSNVAIIITRKPHKKPEKKTPTRPGVVAATIDIYDN